MGFDRLPLAVAEFSRDTATNFLSHLYVQTVSCCHTYNCNRPPKFSEGLPQVQYLDFLAVQQNEAHTENVYLCRLDFSYSRFTSYIEILNTKYLFPICFGPFPAISYRFWPLSGS